MRPLLPLLLAAAALAQSPATAPGAEWESRAALVVTGSYGRTTAGDAYEPTLASAHADPSREDLALGGAELFGRMGRDWGDGRVEVVAAFHVHRHPGETTESELEEIHAEWSRGAIKARAGIFYAPLGLTNSLHAHAWSFANAPIFYGRFLGAEGLRNPGAQLAWESEPGSSLWTFALQRASGDTAFSFRSGHEAADYLGRVHDAGRGEGPLVTVRNERAYRWEGGQSLASGVSVAAADNGTGGATQLIAWDLEWRRESSGGRWLGLEAEFLWRDFEAEAGADALGAPVAADRLQDLAFSVAVLAAPASDWTVGLRAERALPLDRGDYESAGRDAAREARTRLSPLVSWKPAEGLLVRLQYDHDRSPVFGTEDSAWLTVQWTLGRH